MMPKQMGSADPIGIVLPSCFSRSMDHPLPSIFLLEHLMNEYVSILLFSSRRATACVYLNPGRGLTIQSLKEPEGPGRNWLGTTARISMEVSFCYITENVT